MTLDDTYCRYVDWQGKNYLSVFFGNCSKRARPKIKTEAENDDFQKIFSLPRVYLQVP